MYDLQYTCSIGTNKTCQLPLQLILNAKCQAIRDAQLLEKEQIVHELTDEEKRLDDMMEIDRVNAIRTEEEIQHKIRQERLIGAKKIMDQIAENEQVRVMSDCHSHLVRCRTYVRRYVEPKECNLHKKKYNYNDY